MAAVNFVDKGWNRIKKELKAANGSYTKIGILTGAGTEENGTLIVDVAKDNEYGTNKIPARPFMRTSFDESRIETNRIIDKLYSKIFKGENTTKQSLDILGLYMTGKIQKKITDIRTPVNSPVTIAIKKSSNPLIDTGTMRRSVTHKRVMKNG